MLRKRFNDMGNSLFIVYVFRLYLHGFYSKVHVLYPKVEFPVSTGTPFLSTYVEWAHQDKWALPLYLTAHRTQTASCTFVTSIHDNCYMRGHVIGNKTLLPFSYALVVAWDTLAMSLDVPKKSINVEFRDVKLYTQPILHDQKTVRLSVSLHRGNGRFEIMDEQSRVATGFIASTETPLETTSNSNTSKDNGLEAREVYQILYERGYAYSGAFRSIYSTNETMSGAKILWNDNWVTFIDGLFQLNTLNYTQIGVAQPDHIGRMIIDVTKQLNVIPVNGDSEYNVTCPLVGAVLSKVQCRTRCGGLLMENLRFRNVLQMNDDVVTLQTLKFVPRFNSDFDVSTALYVLLQIAAENINKDSINILGLTVGHCANKLFESMNKITEAGIPKMILQYRQVSIDNDSKKSANEYQNVDVILVQNLSKNEGISQSFHQMLPQNTFIINEEDITRAAQNISPELYNVVSVLKNTRTELELAYWKPAFPISTTSTFTVRSDSDLPLLKHARDDLSSQSGLFVLSSYPPEDGLIGIVKEWRREETRNHIHVIMVNEKFRDELDEGPNVILAYSVFDNGSWGGEYYLPLEETSTAKDNFTLRSEVIGDINSLKWVQAPELTGPGTLVAVHYAGINTGDVKQAFGLLHNSSRCVKYDYGIDFSGITERGERVMGVVPSGAASSYVMAQPELTWPVPAHWSLEDAATVPFAYVCVYYCFMRITTRTILKAAKQFTVLVHGGAGALGQAAISVALARGWRVFTTVGDCDKKRFLISLFPQLSESDIGNSRDASFGEMVRSATNGAGCNVVICCLKGELKNVSLSCSGSNGILLDTVQIHSNANHAFGMYNLTQERSYVAVDMTSMYSNPKSKEMQKIHALVSEGIASGEVRPLTRLTFGPDEAARAFRLLAASRHRGRALLRLAVELAPPPHRITSEAGLPVHMIICGVSPLGVQVADKLIERGITNLHLRTNAPTGYLQYKLRVWEKQNIQTTVTYGDFEEKDDIVSGLLQNAATTGVVEGLHIIADQAIHENFINKIDLTTRTLSPSLKHFVVVSINGCTGRYTCAQRAKSGLPATLLDFSLLEKVQDVDGGTWYRSAAIAVERALQTTDPVLLAVSKRRPQRPLVQQIAALVDLKISKDITSSVTLESLGMSIEKTAPVCAFLSDVYNTSFDEDFVPLLTVERLYQIEDAATETQLNDFKGLEMFYSDMDTDELSATTEIVFLPTLTNNYTMRDDEYDVNDTFLCIVPGLEGHHARFRALCERLKLPAFVLQPGLDRPDETPAELALRYSKVLLKKTCMKKTFYILGYETGVIVALELAAILEEHGLTGTVFCLGDGPAETAALLERSLSPYPDAVALQEAVARHMFALMTRGSGAGVERALLGCSSWSARVDACVRALLGRAPHSAQYARAVMEAAYTRIAVARRAVAAPRTLRSRLVLLRARSERDDGERDTCSLQRYSQQALHARKLAAPMAHAAADPRAPAIINSYLNYEILQAFEKKNLCDTHLTNADAFMVIS